ncbi:hypothetical protein EVAR_79596_1 [Eumeta japonica]|uniref:Uncharacterized protein n=1 Tax=Eumeta variegata TaxID=151549 RepID=A0A4C1UEJ0_EUMVA|nr:hypothetical protein EVAR_79596_1 [Eumeta japonica]
MKKFIKSARTRPQPTATITYVRTYNKFSSLSRSAGRALPMDSNESKARGRRGVVGRADAIERRARPAGLPRDGNTNKKNESNTSTTAPLRRGRVLFRKSDVGRSDELLPRRHQSRDPTTLIAIPAFNLVGLEGWRGGGRRQANTGRDRLKSAKIKKNTSSSRAIDLT